MRADAIPNATYLNCLLHYLYTYIWMGMEIDRAGIYIHNPFQYYYYYYYYYHWNDWNPKGTGAASVTVDKLFKQQKDTHTHTCSLLSNSIKLARYSSITAIYGPTGRRFWFIASTILIARALFLIYLFLYLYKGWIYPCICMYRVLQNRMNIRICVYINIFSAATLSLKRFIIIPVTHFTSDITLGENWEGEGRVI